MRIAITLLIIGVLANTESGETSSATSLLTAERRAHEAAERLRLPTAGPARWKAGGQGWAPAWTAAPTKPRHAPPD